MDDSELDKTHQTLRNITSLSWRAAIDTNPESGVETDEKNSFGVKRFQYRRQKLKYYLWMHLLLSEQIKQKAVITGERLAHCKSSVQTPSLLQRTCVPEWISDELSW